MYIVIRYVLDTKHGDGYLLRNIDTDETRSVTAEDLKELVALKKVYNADAELNITGRKEKTSAVMFGEQVQITNIRVSDTMFKQARKYKEKVEQEKAEQTQKPTETQAESASDISETHLYAESKKGRIITPLYKFRFIQNYCETVKGQICNGKVVTIAEIRKALNPDSQNEELINNGDYTLSDEDTIIPIEMYMAFYSLDGEITPLWTNLICYNERYNNYIKISQVLSCSYLSDSNEPINELHCDNGNSYINDCTTSINEMVYYGIDWLNRENEIYKRARQNYGAEIVDTTLGTIPYENIRNFVHKKNGTQ